MKITENLLVKTHMLYDKFKKNGEKLSRDKIQSELSVTSGQARTLKELIDNKHLIKPLPKKIVDTIDAKELVICDPHMPYHDYESIELELSYAEKHNANIISILGDFLDFYQISRFCKDPQKRDIDVEIETGLQFLKDLRYRFPKARIIYKLGNHDERLEKYIFDQAPKLSKLLEHLLEEKLELEKLNIEYIRGFFQIGKLWHLHGHELTGRSGGGVNICDTVWRSIYDHFICGHFHQTHSKSFKLIDKTVKSTNSVGWSADDEAGEHSPLNKFTKGFGFVEYDAAGNFQVDNFKIYDGVIYK